MTVFANIAPTPRTDGIAYCTNALLPGAEADLFNLPNLAPPSPICIPYGQRLLADVLFTAVGVATDSGSYVVLQTDNGDGNWIDLAWCTTTLTGTLTDLFALFVGDSGDPSLVVHQTRAAGTAPSPVTGQNLLGLGGRFRFVGKGSTSLSSSSSSGAAGVVQGLFVSINYRLLGQR